MRKIGKLSSLFFITLSFLVTSGALANGPSLVPTEGKENGDYDLNDFVLVAVNISQWVLILSGSLALLAFVYGGFLFVLSHGNKDLVEKGKSSITAAVIGLLIVLFAFTAINFIMEKLGFQEGSGFGKWNSTN